MIGRFKMKIAPPPGKKLIRDWNGLRVRTLREMESGMLELPVGIVCTVSTSGGTGLQLRTDKCECCGVAVYISRVHSVDVEVVA